MDLELPGASGQIPIDPNSPSLLFVSGVLDLFYGAGASGEEPDLDTVADAAEKLLNELPGPIPFPGSDPKARAKSLLEQAWDAEDEKALDLTVQALRIAPRSVEAYTTLGVALGDAPQLAMPMLTLAVNIGYTELGDAFFEANAGQMGTIPEAQPFMDALMELARLHRESGMLDIAATEYAQLLDLDPEDGHGASVELLWTLLQMGDHAGARTLLESFGDDASPMLAYARTLEAFQRLGDSPEARARLAQAQKLNQPVAEMLGGIRPLPTQFGPSFEPGSVDEAVLLYGYAEPAFEATRNALRWLKAQSGFDVVAKQAAPEKAKRSGPRQV